ncbi:MAG: Nif3-like dinuclear metal center hexameric protein [Anaerosolibacter sp.]|jgi:dinuclear metal center YbgI/SA1388 family protein|uniref:Nif3-like dinuclear metal center hexameric protein n=1 Tax=Anaerosolibacter sp. TaxID=1872527 RepID=UPI00261F9F47|nr:Nif3-like dinuclear metal center hexameric protein [Anaerosolibacter sp.]MDF2548179.1 Nif3-like dinuclear metal center hexameric protein [Anaerosolibacter sp.]
MPEKCKTIINLIEGVAPVHLAEPWDNVGLQVGNPDREVHRVMVCLEVTEAVIDEAIEKRVDMIITHHPLIFKAIKSICASDPVGKLLHKLIRHDIILYCAHTNLDTAVGGTNDVLAQALNLEDVIFLKKTYQEIFYKLVVYVPETHIELVRASICEAGGGHIGDYRYCTYQTMGTGTFMPLKGSNPYIGKENELEKVAEYRLETIVSHKNLKVVIQKMKESHPYEEAAYDVFALNNNIESFGMGRMGMLKERIKLSLLCDELKLKLGLGHIKVAGDVNRWIQKVALCTGSGAEFIYDAHKAGCDCFITGDVKYHDAQYAAQLGIAVIDAGHFETEDFACKIIAQTLREMSKQLNYHIDIVPSMTYINPFNIL